ncbi:MAG: enoyl-CoA hydratase [Candidatus Binatia bacterium]|nr:MAG: enoyl-CoA hydratase [Candidatus Binatia bacterium]
MTTIEARLEGGVGRIVLDRPEVGNALDGTMVGEILSVLDEWEKDRSVRALVLTGRGKVFSAGADLRNMKAMKEATPEENAREARATARVFSRLYRFPRPVVARVNGAARGGGVGLVAACDLAVAADAAHFAFTEVRLGIVPAMISPYVVRKIGFGAARRLFLTGETFDAAAARSLGLVDEVVPAEKLDERVEETLRNLLLGAPGAAGAVKELLRVIDPTDWEAVEEKTARLLAELRVGDEAQEGMAAFLEKRRPAWAPGS